MSTTSQARDQIRNGYRRAPISGRPRLFGEISKPASFNLTEYQSYIHMRATQAPRSAQVRKAERLAKEKAAKAEPRPKFMPGKALPISIAKGANGRHYALLSNGSIVRVDTVRVPLAPRLDGPTPVGTYNFVRLHDGRLQGVML